MAVDLARETEFETFSFGPEGFTRGARRGRAGAAGAGGFGGFEDILREAFAGAARRGGGGTTFEGEDFGGGVGANVTAALTISLPDAAHGVSQRVRLPSGKDVEAADFPPASPAANKSGFAAKA